MAMITNPLNQAQFNALLNDWNDLRNKMLDGSKFVDNPYWVAPFGLTYNRHLKAFYYLCVGTHNIHSLLYQKAINEGDARQVQNDFKYPFRNKVSTQKLLEDEPVFHVYHVSVDYFLKTGKSSGLVKSAREVDSPLFDQHSLDCVQLNWQNNDRLSDPYWIPDTYKAEQGRVILDALLARAEPDTLWVVSHYNADNRQQNVKCRTWYDIAPIGYDHPENIDIYRRTGVIYVSSKEIANLYVEKRLRGFLDNDLKLVPAESLDGMILPQSGVERWCLIKMI